jgi:DNA replication protein DnaC
VPLLVLDDLGSERVTDWVREQIFLIINSRYEEMLPTVVTTNDTLEELEKHVGQRIISRLMETCQGLILDGEDFRKEAV